VYGNFLTFAGFTILGAATFTGIAMVCASRTASIPMMAGLLNMISIPLMLLSGVFFSKSNFPDLMLPIINILPLTVLADGLRKIALEGLGFMDVGFEVIVLGCYLVVATVIARLSFKWY
jgi:ABC-type polysaccharide/polyol phosphate export permease